MILVFLETPSESLSYTLFTPGSYQVQPQYYTLSVSEWLHLEHLGIQQHPQKQLGVKMKEESIYSPLIFYPYLEISLVTWDITNCAPFFFQEICFSTFFFF